MKNHTIKTLYRKEQILNIVDRCFHMYASDYRNDARIFATEILEEVPDNSHQIEKLEAEKKELLEALEKVKEWGSEFGLNYEIYDEIESLIQKMKQ